MTSNRDFTYWTDIDKELYNKLTQDRDYIAEPGNSLFGGRTEMPEGMDTVVVLKGEDLRLFLIEMAHVVASTTSGKMQSLTFTIDDIDRALKFKKDFMVWSRPFGYMETRRQFTTNDNGHSLGCQCPLCGGRS